jgi:UDP-glucose 4-epimerase
MYIIPYNNNKMLKLFLKYMNNISDSCLIESLLKSIEIENIEIIKSLEKFFKKKVKFVFTERRYGDLDKLVCDNRRAKKILNWKPKTSFEDIIGKMVSNDLKLEAKKANLALPKTPVT